MRDRNRSYQIVCDQSSDSEISFQIFGFQSINPSEEEFLEMAIYFLEERFDRYINIPKYVIASNLASLAIFN